MAVELLECRAGVGRERRAGDFEREGRAPTAKIGHEPFDRQEITGGEASELRAREVEIELGNRSRFTRAMHPRDVAREEVADGNARLRADSFARAGETREHDDTRRDRHCDWGSGSTHGAFLRSWRPHHTRFGAALPSSFLIASTSACSAGGAVAM